jgi:phage terminase small subunit
MPGATLTEGGFVALTDQQKLFCEHYVANGGNGSQAAIAAGYERKSARQQACRLMGREDIQAYINELAAPGRNQRIATADEILEYMSTIVRKKRDELNGGEPCGIKLADANKMAVQLGKYHGLFVDRQEIEEDSSVTIKVQEI